MDLLDRVRPAADDLLGRVDAAFRMLGAPAGHPVWALMLRLGATPSDAVAHIVTLAPESLRETSAALRRSAGDWPATIASLPAGVDSRGIAAEAYAATRPVIAEGLGGLVDGLTDTSDYVDDVADWMARARRDLAGELAACLGSREALTLRSAGVDHAAILAAAEIGARVLTTVSTSLDEGWQVRDKWSAALAEHATTEAASLPAIHATHRIDVR